MDRLSVRHFSTPRAGEAGDKAEAKHVSLKVLSFKIRFWKLCSEKE